MSYLDNWTTSLENSSWGINPDLIEGVEKTNDYWNKWSAKSASEAGNPYALVSNFNPTYSQGGLFSSQSANQAASGGHGASASSALGLGDEDIYPELLSDYLKEMAERLKNQAYGENDPLQSTKDALLGVQDYIKNDPYGYGAAIQSWLGQSQDAWGQSDPGQVSDLNLESLYNFSGMNIPNVANLDVGNIPAYIEQVRKTLPKQYLAGLEPMEEATQGALNQMASRGIVNSDVTGEAFGQIANERNQGYQEAVAGANSWAANELLNNEVRRALEVPMAQYEMAANNAGLQATQEGLRQSHYGLGQTNAQLQQAQDELRALFANLNLDRSKTGQSMLGALSGLDEQALNERLAALGGNINLQNLLNQTAEQLTSAFVNERQPWLSLIAALT